MGGKEERGRIKAAWYLKMGNTASLPEAGEGQVVSSLKGEFFSQLHLGSFSPKKTGTRGLWPIPHPEHIPGGSGCITDTPTRPQR